MENSEQIKEWAKGYAKKLSEETTANEEKHLNHPFYAEANQYRETVRREQVLKGAHKYPEPFNPFSWSPKELLQHAMQENVDQGHYEYGLYLWIEQMEKERDEARQDCEKYRKKWIGVITQLNDKAKEIEDLKITNEKLNNRAKNWEKTACRNAEKAHNELDRLTIRANGNYNAMLEVEKERDQFKKQYLKAHAEIQDLLYKLKVAENEKETAKLKIGEKNKHITELTQIRSDLEQQIFDLKNEKAHECHKNQAIHWQGKDIVKVKCQICDKTLYQA